MRDKAFIENLERVFLKYKECHDLDVAILLCGITDTTAQEAIRKDSFLSIRMQMENAEYKALLNRKLDIMRDSADSDSVRLNALKMQLQSDYPERYKEKLEVSGAVDYIIKPRAPIARPTRKLKKKVLAKGKKK